ncbi:MAG: PAS domain S-box protein [Deltaproteobacteria bacterium]|nr:PAS domain S-box protein [Deltaproteobacteria bacterium]MBW1923059.1 PAS domain S-box protein [Deltaproteobacteria bacterium]MBW1949092.1 PAS domain S-box protein [Deltaproteobacteria bacterium]MBW2008256.1 PAS domain S-box protein [Deltaproteobacteria bacterium]MBW2102232.1 PAS domain S-box protein [Deltaproteobacteria bacterium]
MGSNDSLSEKLKRVSRELSTHRMELHQTRAYLHSILSNSNDMIFATDVGGILLSFSKGGEKVLGYTWEEAAGRFIQDFAVDPGKLEEHLAAAREKGSSVEPEFPFKHKDGHTVFCAVSLIRLTNPKGQTVGTVGICRDITLWKKIQDDLVRIDRLAEIGRTAAGIAHEINNPLAIISEISGWAKSVVKDAGGLSGDDREELETALSRILEQTKRCRNITHQLLDFSRDSAPTKKSFDLHAFLRETTTFLRPEIKHEPIEFVFDFSEKEEIVDSDPRLLEQVFVNLITNAIYAVKEKRPDKGLITLGVSSTEKEVRIRISDNGKGIPHEEQEKIFELFYTTKPPGVGTGLGLPICQQIIQKLGGKLTLESKPGEGTTFQVTLPRS